MFNSIYRKLVSVARDLRRRAAGLELRSVGWYAGLALLLTALGTASWAWRSRGAMNVGIPETGEAQNPPLAAMAVSTPSPVDALTSLPAPEPTEAPLTFEWPVSGEIIGEYAPDSLVWSDTLEQWQTHPAVDIAAAAGEAVRACAPGVVTDVWEDALWGMCIRLEHPQGYASLYANLSTLQLVRRGDSVEAGQTISAVGHTALCESEMGSHLHFAIEKDGVSADFAKLVK